MCFWAAHRHSDIPIHFGMAAREWRLVCKNRWFCNFNWLSWQHPLSDRQIKAGFIKSLYSSTNPKHLVNICLVVPEISLLIGLPTKNNKNKEKTSAKYITHGASLAGRLNNFWFTGVQVTVQEALRNHTTQNVSCWALANYCITVEMIAFE